MARFRPFRITTFPSRQALAQVLAMVLILEASGPLSAIAPRRRSTPPRPVPSLASAVVSAIAPQSSESGRPGDAVAQDFGTVPVPGGPTVTLQSLDSEANAHYGIDYHPLTKKIVVSANTPNGEPHNFEQIAAGGSHSRYTNVSGMTGELIIAVVREGSAANDGRSIGGFGRGEMFFAAARMFGANNRDGVISRVSADGSSVQQSWVKLPSPGSGDEQFSRGARTDDFIPPPDESVGGLHVDTTGLFGGDLIAVTGGGDVWRINEAGVATRLAQVGMALCGVIVVPGDSDRYGPWAGKIVSAAFDGSSTSIAAVDGNGAFEFFALEAPPSDSPTPIEDPYRSAVDLEIVPAHQNFFGIDEGPAQKIVAARAEDFADLVGDVVIAFNGSLSSSLSRVTWNGQSFIYTTLAEANRWNQITFAPVGILDVPDSDPVFDRIAVVRHSPVFNSGRVEGNLWQLLGEALVLNGTDTITLDLLVPGTPQVNAPEAPFFGGVLPGSGNPEPSGYPIAISGRATVRHLITRTDPIELPAVPPPPAPAGTKDAPEHIAPDSIVDWPVIRNVRLKGNDGVIAVPPGTYGRFTASGRTGFEIGVAGATSPSAYNLEELELSGAAELRVAGPVVLTVRNGVMLGGGAVAGASDNARHLALRISDGGLTMNGHSVLYSVVRAPKGHIVVEGTARLRGTVACDQLTVSGDGVLQVTETDLVPAVNRPPLVDAGPDQTITLPENAVELEGIMTDDGLPAGAVPTAHWTVDSGPAPVTFLDANSASTKATFTAAGTYVLRLTASDSLLTDSDTAIITVVSHNQAPQVSAGADLEVTLPNAAALSGSVIDDGLPLGDALTIRWSVVSGPGPVEFEEDSAPATAASFTVAGVYVLRLTANDGALESADQVTVTVHLANQPPEVSAGPDQMITPPLNTIRLGGSVADDGMPAGVPLTVSWTQISGPVQAAINDPASAVTTATFTAQGSYVLRLTASDTQFTASDDVEITVGCADATNRMDVMLVIDDSPSMIGKPLADAKAAAKSFIDNLDLTVDQVGVVSFSFTPILHQTLTRDAAAAKAAVDRIVIGNGTNIGIGITTAQAELASVRHDPHAIPVMLVLSDGESNQGDSNAAANLAKAAGTRIIAIAISSGIPLEMRRIASSLNDLYITPSSQDLAWIYAVIAGSVCRNQPPLVRAGADFEVTLPNKATLSGEVHDDGLPANSRLTSSWRVVSGPAPVSIFDVDVPLTTAVFSEPGVYELEITGTDSIATMSDTVVVTVHPEPSLENAFLSLVAGGTGPRVIGTSVTLTATLSNSSGAPMGGFPVTFVVSGSNAQTASVITNASGVAAFALRGTVPGTDSVEAKAESRTLTARSGIVTLEWTAETPPGAPPPPIPSTTQGWLGGPLHLSTVDGQVPVTVGAGIMLTEGVVEYWSVSNPSQVTVLATNVQAGPGTTIATFDTTLLANGSYIIRLRGKNAAAGGSSRQVRTHATQKLEPHEVLTASELASDVMVVVVGENKPGRVVVNAVDFTVPLSGIPITIGRRYDSLDRLRSGDFGNGWSLDFGSPRLEVNPANGVTLTDPSTGRRVSFAFTPRSFGTIFLAFFMFPAFTPEPGENGSLQSDGCSLLMRVGGELLCAFGIDTFRPTVYQYTDKEGRAYIITADGVLRSAKDLNGNTLTFSPQGITSSAGVTIPLHLRDTKGRIVRIPDTQGRDYFYTYDTAGDLVAVTLPGITTPIRYTYDPGHRLLTQRDPRGNLATVTTYTPDGRVESVTDGVGNTTRYSYNLAENTTTTTNPDGGVVVERVNSAGLPVEVTDESGKKTRYEYDADLNLIAEENALGQITRYQYDEVGNQILKKDPGGRIVTTTYNEFNRPVAIRDELGRVRTLLYDARFNLIGVADSLGAINTYTVDLRGNPISHTDGSGATTIFTYNASGHLIAKSDPLGNVTTYTYTPMGRVQSMTDPRENFTRLVYDTLDRVVRRENALSQPTIFGYDGNGNRTSMTDALSRITRYEYDAANRLVKTIFHDGTFISCTYDFRGNKVTETDQLLRTTTHTYDLAGRRVKTRHHDGAEERFEYDAIGRLIRHIDELGRETTYEYDPACACSERVAKITRPLNRTTIHVFDAAGRLVGVKDPAGRETRATLDVRDRVTELRFHDGTTMRWTHDGEDRILTATDQAQRITHFKYDAAGNLESVRDPLDQTTLYKYDAANNLVAITDANLFTRTFEYDRLNRPSRRLVAGRIQTYSYDAAGNFSSTRDFNGRTITYVHDALNRLIERRATTTTTDLPTRFTYTATGQRKTMSSSVGTTTYAYDDRDRLLSKQTPAGTLTYTYDPVGNVLSLRSSTVNGASVDYTYDEAHRLTSVRQNGPAPGTTVYEYDLADNLIAQTLPNGVRTVVTRNAVDRVTALTLSRGATTLAGYTYGVGADGQRDSVTEHNGRRIDYTYDAARRLQRETITGAPAPAGNGAVDYTLDALGNRLSRVSTLAGVPAAAHTYVQDSRLVGDTYDLNGNTTASGGRTFGYDFENRLRSIGGAGTFAYDGDGNRFTKTFGGVTTLYLVDDLSPSGYPDVVEELVSGAGLQRVFTHGLGLIGQRRLVSGSWVPRYFGQDAHGSVRVLTDGSGAVTDSYDYDAFGVLLSSSGTTPVSYLYGGEQFDTDLGGYFLRERYYDPQRGRFYTADPFPGVLDIPKTQHSYLYVGADPVNWIDPSGLTETFEKVYLRSQIYLRQKLPCVVFSYAKAPDLVENIAHALMAGHPGHGTPLIYDPKGAPGRRKDALEQVIRYLSRDEWPPASTLQGGKKSWVGHIPGKQNSYQGGVLSQFYKKLKPGQKFRVCLVK